MTVSWPNWSVRQDDYCGASRPARSPNRGSQREFGSCPRSPPRSPSLDRDHLWTALRYVDLNPVRAHLVREASEYDWSSARAHVEGRDRPGLIDTDLWKQMCPREDWKEVLGRSRDEEAAEMAELRQATASGRPLGGDAFVERLGRTLRRKLNSKRTGRPKKAATAGP